MLRTRLNLSLAADRSTRLAVALGAALLVGSAAIGSLLHTAAPAASRLVELTSGGKFAARVPGAAADPDPASDTGLASLPGRSLKAALEMALVPLAIDTADPPAEPASGSTLDAPARPRSRPLRASALRRAADAAPLPVARPSSAREAEAVPVAADDGVLPRLTASARSAWSFSAAAGTALLSHVLP